LIFYSKVLRSWTYGPTWYGDLLNWKSDPARIRTWIKSLGNFYSIPWTTGSISCKNTEFFSNLEHLMKKSIRTLYYYGSLKWLYIKDKFNHPNWVNSPNSVQIKSLPIRSWHLKPWICIRKSLPCRQAGPPADGQVLLLETDAGGLRMQ
jgi:hypothetical protein